MLIGAALARGESVLRHVLESDDITRTRRILCAAGYSKVSFNPDEVTLSINGIPIFRKGKPVSPTRAKAEKAIRERDIVIEVVLTEGKESATVWTCDFSHEYVNINASYIS
jgi:glutamate N-acetyltransferase/amino-acid N-acetyltransferase